MFKAALLISCFFVSTTFASVPVYKLSLDLTLNGKQTVSKIVSAMSGQKSEIQEKTEDGREGFIEVTPEAIKEEPGKVHLKFVVGLIVNGERRPLSMPEMIVREGKSASITVGEDDGPEMLTLSVLANRSAARAK